MLTIDQFYKKVYADITPERVLSWITPDPEHDRGILRRLDYAYGFSDEDAKTMHILDEDRNKDGIIQLLKQYTCANPEIEYIIQQVENTCRKIKDLHHSFLVADYEEFHNNAKEFFHTFYAALDDPSNGLAHILPQKSIFYRMRKIEKSANTTKINFFHVPFDKRYLMGTYRYSIPGYPSLYGASSIYCAWEEMGREDVKNYGYIAFKTTNPIQLLDLRWRFDKEILESDEAMKYYLIKLPIIIACSMQVHHTAEKFVPEYIFPHLIFQWLMSKLKSDTQKKNRTTLGVIYTSTKQEIWDALKAKETRIDDMTNYALLAYISPDDVTQYSKTLALKLNVQTPRWIEERVSAKMCPYEILSKVQGDFTDSPRSYWKNMSLYLK